MRVKNKNQKKNTDFRRNFNVTVKLVRPFMRRQRFLYIKRLTAHTRFTYVTPQQ